MRKLLIGAAALLLAGCGGETYQMPVDQAFQTLSSVGSSEFSPLPGGLYDVAVRFESVPADNTVQWLFSHDGDDLGRFIAKVQADGATASTVTIDYVEGSAPDENWRNGQARTMLQTGVAQLVNEAVDSKMESRPFDQALRAQVAKTLMMTSMGGVMQDVSASMDAHIAKQKQREMESVAAAEANPYSATAPATDLSKFD